MNQLNLKRGKWLVFIGVILGILSTPTTLVAQTKDLYPSDAISILSWKRGPGEIVSKQFDLVLGSNEEEFVSDIAGKDDGRKYQLSLKKFFSRTLRKPSIQCWEVTLKELKPFTSGQGFILAGNLLSDEAPGGLHSRVNLLCPIEVPHKSLDSGHYSIWQKRRFRIEAFQVTLHVKNYKYDENENRLVTTNFEITLENQ